MTEAKIDNRESKWSLQGMTALDTGGTKEIGFFLCLILFLLVSVFSLKCIIIEELIG
jgi:hypothetical protein